MTCLFAIRLHQSVHLLIKLCFRLAVERPEKVFVARNAAHMKDETIPRAVGGAGLASENFNSGRIRVCAELKAVGGLLGAHTLLSRSVGIFVLAAVQFHDLPECGIFRALLVDDVHIVSGHHVVRDLKTAGVDEGCVVGA